MTARSLLHAHIASRLPADIAWLPYARDMDPPATSTAMLRLDSVEPGPAYGQRLYRFAIVIVAAKSTVGAGDDELEAALEDVLHVLEEYAAQVGIIWSTATRGVFPPDNPTQPAFEISIAAAIKIEE